MPMGRCRRQMCAPIRGLGFIQLTKRRGAKQHPLALDEGQIGRDDDLGGNEQLANFGT
jgi:hypothetical protein